MCLLGDYAITQISFNDKSLSFFFFNVILTHNCKKLYLPKLGCLPPLPGNDAGARFKVCYDDGEQSKMRLTV